MTLKTIFTAEDSEIAEKAEREKGKIRDI